MTVAIDFGTCNTVAARWNAAEETVRIIRVPHLTRRFRYQIPGTGVEQEADVIPSLIHYGENDSVRIGAQVENEGLVNHSGTFRWLKLDVLRNNKKTRRIYENRIGYHEAAAEFFRRVLLFISGSIGGMEDGLIVTVPVEAYDHYVNWLLETANSALTQRIQVIDEATACILGYRKSVRDGDMFLIFDFGGGTLDISLVKTDLKADGAHKCKILGRAGEEIGGMLVDRWMLEHLMEAETLTDNDLEAVGAPLLQDIENAKIVLSSGKDAVEITRFNDISGRLISHEFTQKELVGLLDRKGFKQTVVRTVDRALEYGMNKYAIRKSEIRAVLMVGGTSLLVGVRDILNTLFPDSKVFCTRPFDAIAAGACRYAEEGVGGAALVHDYCLMSWNGDLKEFQEIPIIPKGTGYPTDKPVCGVYITSAADDADVLEFIVHERSEIISPDTAVVVDENGQVRCVDRGQTCKNHTRPLNPENREFLFPDPVCSREDVRRFVAGFGIDASKRLTISLKDTRPDSRSYIKTGSGEKIFLPVKDFPLVRL